MNCPDEVISVIRQPHQCKAHEGRFGEIKTRGVFHPRQCLKIALPILAGPPVVFHKWQLDGLGYPLQGLVVLSHETCP